MSGVLSLRPSQFVEGGLIDDINAKITDAKFTLYDYNGKQDVSVPALGLELELEDGTKHESYYSAGDAKYWSPSGDGKTLLATGDKTSLTKGCKLGIFLQELVMAGFPEDKLAAGDITCLVGLNAHFQRKADPARKGLVRTGQNADREQSTLVVTKILGLPGEQVKKPAAPVAGAPSTASTTSSAASTGGSTVSDDDVTNLLMELLSSTNPIPKNKVSQLAFKAIGKDHAMFAQRTAVTQRIFSDEFLKAGAASGLWSFDGTNISIG